MEIFEIYIDFYKRNNKPLDSRYDSIIDSIVNGFDLQNESRENYFESAIKKQSIKRLMSGRGGQLLGTDEIQYIKEICMLKLNF